MVGFGPPANRQARREWWRRQIQRQRLVALEKNRCQFNLSAH
jgi:hypothetical protein